jgi:acetyl esterase/lipase
VRLNLALAVASILCSVVSAAGAALVIWPSAPERIAYYQLQAGGMTERLSLVGLVACLLALPAVRRKGWLGRAALALSVASAGINAILAAPVWVMARSLGYEISLRETSVSSEDPELVTFGSAGLEADLYRPRPTTALKPALVVVHGGAWRHGDKGENVFWNDWLVDRSIVVLDIQYRLAPDATWRQQLADIREAVDWLRQNADPLGVDPARIALMGRSAGGHLALLAAFASQPAVSRVIALYAPTDLARLHDESTDSDVRDGVEALIGGPPITRPDDYRAASPLFQATSSAPPTLLIHGTWDELVPADHSLQLVAKLSTLGVRVESLTIPYARHAFDLVGDSPASQLARQAIAAFLPSGSLR